MHKVAADLHNSAASGVSNANKRLSALSSAPRRRFAYLGLSSNCVKTSPNEEPEHPTCFHEYSPCPFNQRLSKLLPSYAPGPRRPQLPSQTSDVFLNSYNTARTTRNHLSIKSDGFVEKEVVVAQVKFVTACHCQSVSREGGSLGGLV